MTKKAAAPRAEAKTIPIEDAYILVAMLLRDNPTITICWACDERGLTIAKVPSQPKNCVVSAFQEIRLFDTGSLWMIRAFWSAAWRRRSTPISTDRSSCTAGRSRAGAHKPGTPVGSGSPLCFRQRKWSDYGVMSEKCQEPTCGERARRPCALQMKEVPTERPWS